MQKMNLKPIWLKSNACRKTALPTLDLNQKLLKKDVEVLNKWGGGIKCKSRLLSLNIIQTKNKNLGQGHGKDYIERIMTLFELTIIVHLKVFCDVFAAGLSRFF